MAYTVKDFIFEAENYEQSKEHFEFMKEYYQTSLFEMYVNTYREKEFNESNGFELSENFSYVTESVFTDISIEVIEEKMSEGLSKMKTAIGGVLSKIKTVFIQLLNSLIKVLNGNVKEKDVVAAKEFFSKSPYSSLPSKITFNPTALQVTRAKQIISALGVRGNADIRAIIAAANKAGIEPILGGELQLVRSIKNEEVATAIRVANRMLTEKRLIIMLPASLQDISSYVGKVETYASDPSISTATVQRDINFLKNNIRNNKQQLFFVVDVEDVVEIQKNLKEMKSSSDNFKPDAKGNTQMHGTETLNAIKSLSSEVSVIIANALKNVNGASTAQKNAMMMIKDLQKSFTAASTVEPGTEIMLGTAAAQPA